MKHIKMFSQGTLRLLTPFENRLVGKSLIAPSLLIAFGAAIWLLGPYFSFHGYKPLLSPLSRFYFIASLGLIWFLKFLLMDGENAAALKVTKDNKLLFLQSRFRDAMQFLKKTTIKRNNENHSLRELPWFLLIGPPQAGKTALVAKAEINYILQKSQQPYPDEELKPSAHCDWWITPDANIIDIPSRYCYLQNIAKKIHVQADLYRYFLALTKQERGNDALAGILLTIPLPEILQANDQKTYARCLHHIFQQFAETRKIFSARINVTLVITKCDLLAGFNEYFSEPSREEIAQAWGIQLPGTPQRRIHELVAERFNNLIKKLNQQLLWRLHHERNPHLRPAIKEFPLQLERLKECTIDFVRKYAPLQNQFPLQGIYLTSALQKQETPEQTVISFDFNDNQYKQNHEVQLFTPPHSTSRPYFIKQLLLQGLKCNPNTQTNNVGSPQLWVRFVSYGVAATFIGMIAFYLGKDFELGLKKVYAVKTDLNDYQVAIKNTHNSEQQLLNASQLLNTLETQATATNHLNLNISQIFKFYSYKSQLNVNAAYQKSIQTILLPAIRNYLAEQLQQPINQAPTLTYRVLKTYLMLGETQRVDTQFILRTFNKLPLKLFSRQARQDLNRHILAAFTSPIQPLVLDDAITSKTRRFLTALPTLQLAQTILLNGRTNDGAVNLAILKPQQSIFISHDVIQDIPDIYTRKNFALTMQDIPQHVNEAIHGNWVLGVNPNAAANPEIETKITLDLRDQYVKDYIALWEGLITNLQLVDNEDLLAIDNLLLNITSKESPFLKLLQAIHANTYFEPVVTASPRLQNIGILIEKSRDTNNLLYQIFAGVKSLHFYIRPILDAHNAKKASFNLVATRMKNPVSLDAITQLRVIASKSPEPVNTWLLQITDDTWNLLMKNASQYIDTSWHNVTQIYQRDIANRFPFNGKAKTEVKLENFIQFFGYPGVVTSYFEDYLQPFVDTSTPAWHWKIRDNRQIFLSEEKLRQIQYAMKIHQSFFPNHDNKLNLQFTLQPYEFSKNIKSIRLKIDDKEIVGNNKTMQTPQIFTWPSNVAEHNTSVQMRLLNNKPMENKNYAGDWGLFKLVNQYFETAVSKKQMVINFSVSNQNAKYLLVTDGQSNPFMSFNLNHFNLPEHLN